jgi:hypothetical protein
MMVNQLIKALQHMEEYHGNLEVYTCGDVIESVEWLDSGFSRDVGGIVDERIIIN